jgi:hypothetical protein
VYGGLIATSVLLGATHRAVLGAASVADRHLPELAARRRSEPFGSARCALHISGRGATRVEKLAAVATSGIARGALRVCWQNQPGVVNCGSCAKCLRTMAALDAQGLLGAIDTLPSELDLAALADHPAVTRSDRAYLTEIRDVADAHGRRLLVDALDRALGSGAPAAR